MTYVIVCPELICRTVVLTVYSRGRSSVGVCLDVSLLTVHSLLLVLLFTLWRPECAEASSFFDFAMCGACVAWSKGTVLCQAVFVDYREMRANYDIAK